MFNVTLRRIALLIVLGGTAMSSSSVAEDWPNKPVRIIVPFAAGGATDVLGRIMADALSGAFKQQFFVENRPGTSGATGSAMVARQPPDGYTLLMSSTSSHIAAPIVSRNVGYDPLRDFTHVAMIGGPPYALVAGRKFGLTSFDELVKLSRSTPGGITYSTNATGSIGHLLGEYLKQKTGVNLVHVGYRGGAPATTDLLGGHVSLTINSFISIAEYIRSGDLVGIALASKERVAAFPDIPTFAELGYPEMLATSWFALSGPKGMPVDIVQRLNAAVRLVLIRPDVEQRLKDDATVRMDFDPAALDTYFANELSRWSAIAKATQLRFD